MVIMVLFKVVGGFSYEMPGPILFHFSSAEHTPVAWGITFGRPTVKMKLCESLLTLFFDVHFKEHSGVAKITIV